MNEKFYTCRYDRPFKEIMLKESIDIYIIIKCTGLTKEEIENLK